MISIPVPDALRDLLLSIDRKGYKSYKQLQGKSFTFSPFQVQFEHVQGDPFALPTRISVAVDLPTAGFDSAFYNTSLRRLAFEDHLLRGMHRGIRKSHIGIRGSGKSGEVLVQAPSQKVIKRSSILVRGDRLCLIMYAGLPGDGRTILGRECLRLFSEVLPPLWAGSLLAESLDLAQLQRAIDTLEDYEVLQKSLAENGWVGFVADGSLLPRASGVSDLPLPEGGLVFNAPEELSAQVELPHGGSIRGMPVPRGITLIVGGGFHGKSTLLRALQDAVYPHVAGDGRERIATLPTAVKVRAEDGRSVKNVNISAFMDRLPLVESTESFSTSSASGSTSQAVNILEAVEAGSGLLLMDEDTCATNFMIRDARMQKLIARDKEPITPLLDRIEEIYETLGVSSLLVMGGSGDYFDPAHHVIAMEVFEPRVLTDKAKRIVETHPGARSRESPFPMPPVKERSVDLTRLRLDRGKKEIVVQTRGLDALILGRGEVNVRYIEQLVEEGQLETCGWMLNRMKQLKADDLTTIQTLRRVFQEIEERGLEELMPFNNGMLSMPRLQEAMAVINRIR